MEGAVLGPSRGQTYRPLCPLADTTDDHTLLWLLNHIRVGIPELIVQVRHHRHTRAYAFFVTATYERQVLYLRLPLALSLGSLLL